MAEQRHNWAGNYTYSAARIHYPGTIEDVQKLVSHSGKLKALGSAHSFNDIADTTGDMISLAQLEYQPEIDRERHTITVGASARYGQICQQLYREGFALHNLASLPHISVAGAVATSTHGSGERNGSLATAVSAMELVVADGSIVTLSRDKDPEQFPGAVVGLGGLGVVTKLTLDLVPAFEVRQDVYEDLPLAQLEEHFDEIVSAAYSVSLFTDWQTGSVNQVWLKRQVKEGATFELEPEWFGAKVAKVNLHPVPGMPAEACTPQLGISGPWYARLPHFKMEFTPSSGEELQSEYLVPRQHAKDALRVFDRLRGKIAPLLQISEIRTIASDEFWMSPFYRQDRVGFHFTWKKDWESVRQLLPLIEEQLAPLGAIPHWGKLFTMPPEQVQTLYARLPDFQRLLLSFDPLGKFRNAFLDQYIFGA